MIGPEIRPRLHAYLVGILDNLKSPSLQTGGAAGGQCERRRVERVLPFQGEVGLFVLGSQGVALGWRMVAPSARRVWRANGASNRLGSVWQRPSAGEKYWAD
jgi:hypothetical protein